MAEAAVISMNTVDMDKPFVIDPKTKAILFEPGKKELAQHAKRSERFSFYISKKVVEGYDLSLCNSVLVHYQNIDEKTKQVSYGIYSVEDMEIALDNSVSFSWLLDADATEYVGALIFSVHFAATDAAGEVVYDFPTLTYSGITVGATVWNSETIAKEYPDIIAAFEARINALEKTGGSGMIYYNKETSASGASAKKISKAETASWTSVGFHAEPKKDNLVISASSQLFKVSGVTDTYLTMIYLADLGGGGVSSWNDLEDKPFDSSVADGEVTLTFDGNVAGRDYIHIPGDASTQEQYYVKMSGDTPSKESFYGTTAYYVSNGVESSVELTEGYMSTNCIVQEGMGFTLMLGGVAVVMVITATFTMGDMTFEPGVWFHYVVADPDYPSSVTYAGQVETIQHLDEKYIPDTIARVTEVECMINNALGVIENGTY